MSPPGTPGPHAVGLLGLGIHLPERVMTNDEWAARIDTSDEWIVSRTGIRTRRIAGEEESTADLALAAARAALADGAFEPADIDEIVLATDTPEVFIPDTSPYVQDRLGVGHIPCYDLAGSGCAGFVLALDIARSRAISHGHRVLVIGVELLTRLMNWEDRNTCVLFGDAAGAAVVGPGPGAVEIVAATAGTDGSKSDILGVEAGGTRVPITVERAQQGLHKHVVMQGREVFREAVSRMSQASQEVLEKAGVSIDDVALIIPHQANLRILNAVARRLQVPEERVFINVHKYGNTGSASVPLALWEAREQGRIEPGDMVLLTAFGAGFHWAAMLLRF
ncbi:MAG: ketoacyl-ACP synthase III [Gemmatimonadota bacterium]|nr:ketoacyl-ACP synthase III [Gemmatimonadota bacterium]MDE2866549.1 ketoacyl-ACP synthase III [Gemmatimonadota bacterium]MXV96988.1 ketoacyl-ACP synthase III [Gemmatimonadota bacterium]MYB06770.1 ketoacyl-ACP synthase III [Gemmatimonadota bacterium]MYE17901.1 ketoacyl-ACP synthase III [Gemmatimonadota bacterium]